MTDEYNSVDMARHIAYLCSLNCYEYNNTKIQKLLYACYGIFLARRNERLVDERPQAWPYGPVFPKVFNYISKSKKDYKKELIFSDKADRANEELREIVKCFGNYSAGKLSAWSHAENSPWAEVINKDDPNPERGIIIPDEKIRNYFKEKVVKDG